MPPLEENAEDNQVGPKEDDDSSIPHPSRGDF